MEKLLGDFSIIFSMEKIIRNNAIIFSTEKIWRKIMKIIQRPLYMKKILPMINTEFIKIITGVRRSGKSYLLLMIKDELLKHGVVPQ